MKILAIRMKNLASLDGESEIDFTKEPLKSAGIFAITGPTGSGKSTILDALCLALFAKTPRYVQASEQGIVVQDVGTQTISQSDARGILRRGSADGFAEVDFIGIDGFAYRANWSIRRARNKPEGALQSYQISLSRIEANEIIPGKNTELLKEIERLLGLSFDQFTRSVLLAQGDFTAFMKAKKDEKAELLEKLTGTQIYAQISSKIFEKNREQVAEIQQLKDKLGDIELLTEEQILELIESKGKAQNDVESASKTLLELGKEQAWHSRFSELTKAVDDAKLSLQTAELEKVGSKEREDTLTHIEAVQSIKPIFSILENSENQLIEKKKSLESLERVCVELSTKKATLEKLVLEAELEFKTHKTKRFEIQPKLDEAKKLDVQIDEKFAQLKKEKLVLENNLIQLKEERTQLEEKQKRAKTIEQNNENLGEWFSNQQEKKGIVENYSVIESKLVDAQKVLSRTEEWSGKRDQNQKEIEQLSSSISTKSIQVNQQKNAQIEAERAVRELKNQLELIPYNELSSRFSELQLKKEGCIQAEADWKILFEKRSDFSQRKVSFTQQEFDSESNKKRLINLGLERIEVTKEVDHAKQTLEKVRLALAENVEKLRNQLSENEACPVCGSKEHPYVIHAPETNAVLHKLEEEYKEKQEKLDVIRFQENTIQESLANWAKVRVKLSNELELAENELKQKESAWKQISIIDEIELISDDKKGEWIKNQLEMIRKDATEIQIQLNTYQKNKTELDQKNESLSKISKNVFEFDQSLKDQTRKLESLEDQQSQFVTELENSEKSLSEVYNQLTKWIGSSNWFENWKLNKAQYVKQLQDFVQNWNFKEKELEKGLKELDLLLENIKGSAFQLERLESQFAEKEIQVNGLSEDFNVVQKKRNDLFTGVSVLEIEKELQKVGEQLEQKVAFRIIEKDENSKALIKSESQKSETVLRIEELRSDIEKSQQELSVWLERYNQKVNAEFTIEQIKVLAQSSTEWIKVEREALQAINDNLKTALTIVRERETQFEKHSFERISKRDVETILNLQSETKLQQTAWQKLVNDIDHQLKTDENERQKQKGILEQIEAQRELSENWSKLSSIIGSATGHVFRQIAQEFTLDVLLSYANKHLETLSKRYVLQRIPDTLSLQVTDIDMGNEMRTVYSLSGGESFLISLALALALASLSSSKMQVESLFIDEGFGSLDPNTLNIAMDALESLHNQGRKVGVISHVQEMTERIPVQIKVSKQSGGKSLLEIV